MVPRPPNPLRLSILWIGLGLSRLGAIDADRARRTTDMVWPRIVTGLARTSRNAVDIAMVGIAVGPIAIAGVGFATPFWAVGGSLAGGISGGTIALVAQRYGAGRPEAVGDAVRTSVLLALGASIPIAAVCWVYSVELVSLLTDNADAIGYGSAYLRFIGLGIPFASLNLIGSRMFIGMDDAWTPMVLRTGGAVANIVLNAALIFGLGLGVVGAAVGTVASSVLVTALFAVSLLAGRLPGVGPAPLRIDPIGPYLHPETARDLVQVGLPVLAKRVTWRAAELPLLAIVNLFGQDTVAAYVISRRVWDLMNAPGWGFGLGSASLVGQELGAGNEALAEEYGREITRFAMAVYVVMAAGVFLFAEPITLLFIGDPTAPSFPIAVFLVHAATGAIVFRGAAGAIDGALNGAGDTSWPFYSQVVGMFGGVLPLAYLGATTSLGLLGLALTFYAETIIPAGMNYYRFATGRWKEVSRTYRPRAAVRKE